jgi:hypothetical protein
METVFPDKRCGVEIFPDCCRTCAVECERIPAENDDPFFYYPEPYGQGQIGKEADIDFGVP